MMTARLLKQIQCAKSPDKVQKLLKELGDHNEANERGDSLLHAFVRRKDKYRQECLLALLVYGRCDMDGGNKQGFTPLHIAAELNDLQAVKALVAFGCEVNSLNPDDKTPLDIATREDIVTLLVSVGGQTGEAVTRGLYFLNPLRFGESCEESWSPDGVVIKRNYTDTGRTPPTPAQIKEHIDRMVSDSSANDDGGDSNPKNPSGSNGIDGGTHREFSEEVPDRFNTPDNSICQGITLQRSISASKKFKRSPITTPRSLSLTFDDEELHDQSEGSHDQPDGSHDQSEESHDQPNGTHDQQDGSYDQSNYQPNGSHDQQDGSHDQSEESHDQPNESHDQQDGSYDQLEESHDQPNGSHDTQECTVPCSKNTPTTILLNGHAIDQDIEENCGGGGKEGEGKGEGREKEEEGGEEGDLLVTDDVFYPTPFEMESLRTLELRGSVRAKGYSVWQKYKRRLEQSDEQVLGSIGNCLRARSIHKQWTESGTREEGEGDGERREQRERENGDEAAGSQGVGSEPEAFKAKPGDKVLCLDGGGIRGLVQLEILKAIEELTHRRIVDLFDWIVGTSTGGILVLGMVYADMTCRQLHQLYFEMKERVFKNPWLGLVCNTKELETILKEKFGEETMMTSQPKKPKVLICAVNKTTTHLKLTFFNNCFHDAFYNYPVWKVARYTAAAPLHFTECDYYVDGGLLANNPCNDALTRIQDYHKANGGQLSLVVSVGCGQYPAVPLGDTSIHAGLLNTAGNMLKPKNILRLFVTALTGCSEAVSDNCRCRCEQQHPPVQYFRFNPSLPEAIDSIETNGAKLCDLVINAKQLLENNDLKLDLLIQHFYYTAVQQR